MTTYSYNRLQQLFAINWLSNLLSDIKGNSGGFDAAAKTSVNSILLASKSLIGDWTLEWGPHAFSNKPSNGTQAKAVADNTMLLVSHEDPKTGQMTYVLAIAGTNPISSFGWIVEDFQTNGTKPWPFQSDSAARNLVISNGTSVGLKALLNMPYKAEDPDAASQQGIVKKLSDLSKTAKPQTQLVVTGHSLGGALSASLALALKNMQTAAYQTPYANDKIGNWDPNLNFIVSALSSAGATPGNDVFANFFDDQIGSRALRIWNNIDVVPHAWQKSMLKEIESIYVPAIKPGIFIEAAIAKAESNAEKSGATYWQIMEQIGGFCGQVNESIVNNKDAIKQLINEIGEPVIQKWIELIWKDVVGAMILPKNIKNDLIGLLDKHAKGLTEVIIAIMERESKEEVTKLINSLDIPALAKAALLFAYDELVKYLDDFSNFLVQLGYQHVTAYINWMGITAFQEIMKQHKPKV